MLHPEPAPPAAEPTDFFERPWPERLAEVVEMMRDISHYTDPRELSDAYGRRMERLFRVERRLSLSRRGLEAPWFRITRDTARAEFIDPWKEPHRLPLLSGGLLAELIYGDEPRVIDDLEVRPDDPAAPYLAGYRSLLAIPHYDRGEGLNMVVTLRERPGAFNPQYLPELVWIGNLFGRATFSQVMSERLAEALEEIDRDLKRVADIQRSLLPAVMPKLPSLDLAVYYQTSRRAGGDYYDFFPLPDGRLGILIADVSGHGPPAAVHMAITHTLARTYAGDLTPPGLLLAHLNRQLIRHYTAESGTFVTAFFAVYDPRASTLSYASAGHNPPRVVRCADGSRYALNRAQRLPLGVREGEDYPHETFRLVPGDQVIFYTDGITEATNPRGEMFTPERLDAVLADCPVGAEAMLKAVLDALEAFTEGQPPADDRTLLVAKKTAQD
ncbi:MAG TPA: PP2C family protein-serine/threonine phosphatase [Gemmataceae bacterium]